MWENRGRAEYGNRVQRKGASPDETRRDLSGQFTAIEAK
jgi:hypothetical protein